MGLKSLPRHHVNVGLADVLGGMSSLLRGEDPDAIAAFERRFASLIGVRHAVAVGSARTGFYHILRALGVSGKDVVLPAFGFWGMANVALMTKGRPVFADVEPGTLNVSARTLREVVGDGTAVMVPTHLFGGPAPMDEVLELAEGMDLPLIEDCAQANGAGYRDARVGSLGTAGIFSFNLFKNMTAFGGGMVTTNDEELARKVRAYEADYALPGTVTLAVKLALGTAGGLFTRPWVFSLGVYPPLRVLSALKGEGDDKKEHGEKLLETMPREYAVRMATLQARAGCAQLDRLDEETDARSEHAAILTEGLADFAGVEVPEVVPGGAHSYYHYVIKVRDRARLVRELFRSGIDAKTYIGDDCSTMPVLEGHHRSCPEATRAAARGLALPVWHTLTHKDMERTAATIRRVLG